MRECDCECHSDESQPVCQDCTHGHEVNVKMVATENVHPEDILDENGNLIGMVLVEVMTMDEARAKYGERLRRFCDEQFKGLAGLSAGDA
jgi:hypothetical protein